MMKGKNDKIRTFSPFTYHFLAFLVRICFRICHPVIRVKGRENLPPGAAVLCGNHSNLTDPIWVIAWAQLNRLPGTMAKKELFGNALFRWFFAKVGAFPVDRGSTDISAIKNALQTLKDDNKLLIFPEGTRVRNGKKSEPHSGAIVIAHRRNAPIVPIYLSVNKGLFRPIHLIFGTPYTLDFRGEKPDGAALEKAAEEMMAKIYNLGEQI